MASGFFLKVWKWVWRGRGRREKADQPNHLESKTRYVQNTDSKNRFLIRVGGSSLVSKNLNFDQYEYKVWNFCILSVKSGGASLLFSQYIIIGNRTVDKNGSTPIEPPSLPRACIQVCLYWHASSWFGKLSNWIIVTLSNIYIIKLI